MRSRGHRWLRPTKRSFRAEVWSVGTWLPSFEKLGMVLVCLICLFLFGLVQQLHQVFLKGLSIRRVSHRPRHLADGRRRTPRSLKKRRLSPPAQRGGRTTARRAPVWGKDRWFGPVSCTGLQRFEDEWGPVRLNGRPYTTEMGWSDWSEISGPTSQGSPKLPVLW